MAVKRLYGLKSIVRGSTTFDNTHGGPLSWRWSYVGNKVPDRTGADEFATAMLIPEKDMTASMRMRDIVFADDPGDKEDTVVTFIRDGKLEIAITFKAMVFIGSDANIDRSIPGEIELSYDHEHTVNDTASPITLPA